MTDYLKVNWPVPPNVHAWQTTRGGAHSNAAYASLNLATTVGDDPDTVMRNRRRVERDLNLPGEAQWVKLVHGARVVGDGERVGLVEADASYSAQAGCVLVIPTADCLPVLFASSHGDEVAAAHAGWRGLSAGVLENTLARFSCPADAVRVWLGPAIGPERFEVGEDVREAFQASHPASDQAFRAAGKPGKYLADIYALGRQALAACGVKYFYGGDFCTFQDTRFYSYRRQGQSSGRMASYIWFD